MSIIEGFGKGFVNGLYAGGNGIPLLKSFYFRFTSDRTDIVDNHLAAIRIMPPGEKSDLSPNAQAPLDATQDGTIDLAFADKSQDSAKDDYFFKVEHSSLAPARRYQIRATGCLGTCEQAFNIPGGMESDVFVLVGFQLNFTGARDHHIDELSIYERNGNLITKFNDRNDDDVFAYKVDFAMINRAHFNVLTGIETGRVHGGIQLPMPSGPKFIRGFHFDYLSKDRHMREIGALLNDDQLLVLFGDKNGDDPFDFRIEWANISPMAFLAG